MRRPLAEEAVRMKTSCVAGSVLGARALERAEPDAPPEAAVLVKHVADNERRDLVLAQPDPERQREDDVIPEAVAVFAGDLQERGLLELGRRPRRARDGGGVGG